MVSLTTMREGLALIFLTILLGMCVGEDQPPRTAPVDCKLSAWRAGPCSKSCGGGTRTETRSVLIPAKNDGKPCSPELTRTVACNARPCPVDCQVSAWKKSGGCSVQCGGGVQYQTRTVVVKPLHGGRKCPSLKSVYGRCNQHRCPRSCVLSAWSKWSKCSTKCSPGVRTRTRTVVQQSELGAKKPCPLPETLTEKRFCNYLPGQQCRKCKHSDWSGWSACDADCGGGLKYRVRWVQQYPYPPDKKCDKTVESKVCSVQACSEECKVSSWTLPSQCTIVDGKCVQVRVRSIVSPTDPVQASQVCAGYKFTSSVPCPSHKCGVKPKSKKPHRSRTPKKQKKLATAPKRKIRRGRLAKKGKSKSSGRSKGKNRGQIQGKKKGKTGGKAHKDQHGDKKGKVKGKRKRKHRRRRKSRRRKGKRHSKSGAVDTKSNVKSETKSDGQKPTPKKKGRSRRKSRRRRGKRKKRSKKKPGHHAEAKKREDGVHIKQRGNSQRPPRKALLKGSKARTASKKGAKKKKKIRHGECTVSEWSRPSSCQLLDGDCISLQTRQILEPLSPQQIEKHCKKVRTIQAVKCRPERCGLHVAIKPKRAKTAKKHKAAQAHKGKKHKTTNRHKGAQAMFKKHKTTNRHKGAQAMLDHKGKKHKTTNRHKAMQDHKGKAKRGKAKLGKKKSHHAIKSHKAKVPGKKHKTSHPKENAIESSSADGNKPAL